MPIELSARMETIPGNGVDNRFQYVSAVQIQCVQLTCDKVGKFIQFKNPYNLAHSSQYLNCGRLLKYLKSITLKKETPPPYTIYITGTNA